MKYDETITLGNVISMVVICITILIAALRVWLELRDLRSLMEEFPPHRHIQVNDKEAIVYPKRMEKTSRVSRS